MNWGSGIRVLVCSMHLSFSQLCNQLHRLAPLNIHSRGNSFARGEGRLSREQVIEECLRRLSQQGAVWWVGTVCERAKWCVQPSLRVARATRTLVRTFFSFFACVLFFGVFYAFCVFGFFFGFSRFSFVLFILRVFSVYVWQESVLSREAYLYFSSEA